MAVFNANNATLRTSWKLKSTELGLNEDGTAFRWKISMQYRETDSANIVFPTSSILAGSTVVSATLTATARIIRTSGSATKGYNYTDAATISLDGTRISGNSFSKDVTSKFAGMNGGTFADISIAAAYAAKSFSTVVTTPGGALGTAGDHTGYGAVGVSQIFDLQLTNLAIAVEYSGGGGEVTPATKWQKCEVYVCVPVS